mmetsp:Transcript_11689/g.25180  ORF Transcript_11689/g.25180 Transcript_11689/m.25180 type:complete len:225 (+) Transcript_11689:156-830(+)
MQYPLRGITTMLLTREAPKAPAEIHTMELRGVETVPWAEVKHPSKAANPMPTPAVSNGDPNTEATPMAGYPALATAGSAMKSPMQFTQASGRYPSRAVPDALREIWLSAPKTCSSATISFPNKSNQAIVATLDISSKAKEYLGARPSVLVNQIATPSAAAAPIITRKLSLANPSYGDPPVQYVPKSSVTINTVPMGATEAIIRRLRLHSWEQLAMVTVWSIVTG